MFGGVILAVILGGVLACAGRQDAPDAELMKYGGACNATEFNFQETLAKNEKEYRAKAVEDDSSSSSSGSDSDYGAATLGGYDGLGQTVKEDKAPTKTKSKVDNGNSTSDGAPFDAEEFKEGAVAWISIAFVGSFFLGLLLLWMFRSCAHTMVWSVVYLKVGTMGLLTFMFLYIGATVPFIIFLLLTLLSAFCFWLWKDELNLIASMLSVATQGLKDNPHIVTATVGLQFGTLFYIFPAVAAVLAAQMNGHVSVSTKATAQDPTTFVCTNFAGEVVDCCGWTVDPWVPAYTTLAMVSVLWVVSMALEMRLYVIGGTMCQWYFAPAGTTDFSGTVSGAFSNALGPSFGTLCFGSFILTMVEMCKAAMERLRRQERGNILVCLLTACLECIYALIEYISKFATLQAAMTGDSFCDAAASVTDLLQRNFLTAYGTYAFPSMILQGASLVLAIGFGAATWLLSLATYTVSDSPNAGLYAVLVGVISGFIAFVVLCFFVMILLNVVDAVFLCYAMDKDRNMNNHQEFHQIFHEVNEHNKPQGAVVEGPDGGLMYAAV